MANKKKCCCEGCGNGKWAGDVVKLMVDVIITYVLYVRLQMVKRYDYDLLLLVCILRKSCWGSESQPKERNLTDRRRGNSTIKSAVEPTTK